MQSFTHQPVLTDAVIEHLALRPGQTIVDATLGLGGHAKSILERLGGTGKLVGIDQDEQALQAAEHNLSSYQDQLVLVRGNFRDFVQLVQRAIGSVRVDGILFDLGVSSLQLDDTSRGFSFNKSARLDMRMGGGEVTAAEVVNAYPVDELVRIFRDYGEEPRAMSIAKRIAVARQQQPIETTEQLVGIIGGYLGGRRHPATRIFQALRIEVNDELGALERALPQAVESLKPSGRLVVISFHSLEDRIVKHFFKTLTTGGSVRLLTKKAVTPSWEERKKNRRARSAKLRAIEKL
ncbi:TPA: 16S rRNA (cytosine(1402)-N(4))-methyltransferase [Patescibacteria group bacterium]|uniref:Ribosomal RNA small subunit methyltransferase H n=2 Tax=Bacteria division Kazan-3B-28 TaxID=1798534 RepID=A0A0G1X6U0_UNCK3|nr:MAG: S-adenosyl-methyltransferase MraW, 16S rRNA (cytosine1402-N4)-methyltransferase [candidate division Kazan bacterium GW2011_GWA1_50_15]KKW25573.1 MAG: hypothetical protein VE99_C0001G0210 [candidate division Kazan bacterium GW2011_GWC1_52_13]KKW26878.1 MAG: hypothetical protein VF00_C0002G0203 [candidate division Kazan bacterium GW2011_GWB1_52_7]HAV65873.1 16S rRNA (cytosine(1402)-N(4))-methyltransferase [Patescibacteria group bacterium]HCL47483.1 16S rRNA (cytosine(1402)-N(4))-methyltra